MKAPRESGAFSVLAIHASLPNGEREIVRRDSNFKQPTLRCADLRFGAAPPSHFPVPKSKWSAGRRRGVCETPLAELARLHRERLRGDPALLRERRLPAIHPGGVLAAPPGVLRSGIYSYQRPSQDPCWSLISFVHHRVSQRRAARASRARGTLRPGDDG